MLGAFIGVERQIHHLNLEGSRIYYLGLRTFALTALLGTIAGLIYVQIPVLFLLVSFTLLILIIAHYIFDSFKTHDFGITTEITLIFTYLIGVLIATNILSLKLITGITVTLLVLLSQKERLKYYMKKIEEKELRSFISYTVIALVILPIVPNTSYTLSDIPNLLNILASFGININQVSDIELINPFKLWLFVALVTGVEVIGYIIERITGSNKGFLVASFAGGFISSTAITQSLAQKSKLIKSANFLVASALIATGASFIQLLILILPLNLNLFIFSLPIFLMMVVASLTVVFFLLNKSPQRGNPADKLSGGRLFYLQPAIRFALFFLIIKFTSSMGLIVFGQSTFLFLNAIGAIPGLDAVIINIADSSGKSIPYSLGLLAIMLSVSVNILVKVFLSLAGGSKEFWVKFIMGALLIVLTGFLTLWALTYF